MINDLHKDPAVITSRRCPSSAPIAGTLLMAYADVLEFIEIKPNDLCYYVA
jgi:hypothetical protein